jgi:hypothetical protein
MLIVGNLMIPKVCNFKKSGFTCLSSLGTYQCKNAHYEITLCPGTASASAAPDDTVKPKVGGTIDPIKKKLTRKLNKTLGKLERERECTRLK